MGDVKKEHVYILPKINRLPIHYDYGLWIGSAYSTSNPQIDGYKHCSRRSFDFYSISHLYDGGGMVRIESDCERKLYAGDCLMITPGVVNRYGSYGEFRYLEDTVKFAGPVADMLMKAGVISCRVFHLGKVRKLKPIIEIFADPSQDSQLKANIALQNFLMDIYLEHCPDNRGGDRLSELLEMIRNSPEKWWTLDEMAELCQLSKSHLRRVFLQHTGKTPKAYVDQVKVNKACEMLLGTNSTITFIARLLGYQDAYHFSHRFKALIGVSPLHYRNSYQ